MDTQTRHALKTNSFAQATASSVGWMNLHKSGMVRWVIGIGVVVVLGVGSLIGWELRSSAANAALGAAMDTYNAPLAEPGMPAESGSYASATERSQAANKQFSAIASQYGWLPQGSKAHYFVGVTAEDLGQNATAESELKIASRAWNRNLATLAKLALAGLYRQTSRDGEAIALYNALAAKPSETVTAPMAQLNLADLYAAEGKLDQARQLWAKIKDADKDGAAGAIATDKLGAQK